MLLVCTPGALASHLLAAIAVSDHVSLLTVWTLSQEKVTTETLDNFQKNIIWRSLAALGADTLFTVRIGDLLVASTANLSFGTLLQYGTEENILIFPTEKCKYLYLIGTTKYLKIVTSLGDKPLELLGVIARHGSDGIINGLLAQESAQDIRSIGVRLQKLEAANLIICRSVYVDKKHTNQSIHIRFAPNSLVAKQNAEVEEDIHISRDVSRLKQLIMTSLKNSPNAMRGFSDLRKDLKLDGSISEIKFFKAVCNRLHHSGYIEKLHVELPQTKQRVYAMRLIKELNASDQPDPAEPTSEVKDEFGDDELDQGPDPEAPPTFNLIFPPFHQMFLHINNRRDTGITIGEIQKSMLGTSDYRPYTRAFELLPTYLSNSKNLKAFKKYAEPYDDYSVSKLYDHEGKVKFYRYFVTQFCKESKPKPKPFSIAPRVNKASLVDLEKKLKLSIGKISSDSLLKKRERMFAPLNGIHVEPLAPKKRAIKPKETREDRFDDLEPTALAQMAIVEQGSRPKRARKAAGAYKVADNVTNDSSDEAAFEPDVKSEQSESDDAEDMAIVVPDALAEEPSIAPDLIQLDKDQKQENLALKRRSTERAPKPTSSLSSQKRREELVQILEEHGGALVVSGSLLKSLDARLGKTTETDNKTLLRDVAALVKEGVLETSIEDIGTEGKQVKRTLLSLTSHKNQLSSEVVAAIKDRFYIESMNKKKLNRRVIESDLNFHVEEPKQLVNLKSTTRRRERSENRLKSVDDAVESKARAKLQSKGEKKKPEEKDVLIFLKSNRKARKLVPSSSADSSQLNMKRPRRSLKLERSHATTIYRAIVIHRAFSKEAIDFQAIATLIGESDGELVRRKWSTLRRLFGGAEAVNKGVETFQHMVLQGIEDGQILKDDITKRNTVFFLNFWKDFDVNSELVALDDMPLYSTYDLNKDKYDLEIKTEASSVDLAEKIEETSMRQKEGFLANILFTYVPPDTIQSDSFDEIRSVFKSILCIDENELNSAAAKRILKNFSAEDLEKAADNMIKDKEILLVSVDDQKKFLLSERFQSTLNSRTFTEKFFHDAETFRALLADVSKANKGLIISPGITSGEMASLLQLISDENIKLIRIDRPFKFDNYESRLIDREQISCDIIAHNMSEAGRIVPKEVSPVPVVGPCKPIWVNLKTMINTNLWTKVIMIILYHVVLKPGVPLGTLFAKLKVILNVDDFTQAIAWLTENRCIIDSGEGVTATNTWQYILGK